MDGKEFMTPAEVEEKFGIPRGTLANWRCQKRGPRYFIVGRRKIVYREPDVREYYTAQPVLTVDCIRGS